MPLISVILPSCDSDVWIVEAIQSVLQQTHQNLELIIIDDCSTDNTLKLVEGFTGDSRLTTLKRQHCSGGPATPRNEGIKIAKGEYLAFIDSDDVWHPRKLELQILAIQEHGLNFLSSLHTSFQEATPTAQPVDQKIIAIQRKNHQQLLSKNWVMTSSAILSKHLFDGIAFKQSAEYVGVEDYVAWLYVHQRADIQSAVLEAPLVFYRLRKNSISYSKSAMAAKIFHLLSHYQYNGKPLGLKKYYFFATYALSSMATRLTQKLKK